MILRYLKLLTLFACMAFISWNYIGIIFIANLVVLYTFLNDIQHRSFGYRFVYIFPVFLALNVFATFWLFTVDATNSIITYLANSTVMTLFFVLISYLKTNKISNKVTLIIFWPISEWILTKWDIAWPWLTFGNVLANQWFLVQWYSFTGVYSGTAWLLCIALIIYIVITSENRKKYYALLFLLFLIPILSLFTYLKPNDKIYKTENMVCFVPSKQDMSLSNYDKTKLILRYLEVKKAAKGLTLITPELFYSTSSKDLKYSEASYLLNNFLTLNNYKIVLGSEILNDSINKFNGITYVDKEKSLFRTKKKYVPVTEYTSPFLTPFFGKSNYLKNNVDDESQISRSLHSFPFVCYEILFSDFVAKKSLNSNKLLLLTSEEFMNNSFYGRKQYLDIVRLRAIENHRYLLKCSYEGKSVLIAPNGDIVKILSGNYQSVHLPLQTKNTIYQSVMSFLSY
ncbi:hypothetical protein C1637_05845 [Chryseobacterium lactis]|uniref:Apolipoprotein N-acyltransferase N-terminal domain-containing protein n=1 Tax=Chryseobacterium lactis TaxID=1241981 RepID=A0A3G6RIF0_CHRLC|nr:hypothetical protein [Chryseobacterium lactis]AZA84363.1 hypothetical protein EG342_21815 [Chryseobacterium lactis]AZB04751.1 hypothetical protein EG341_12695 [Chryseobacterium lactis]PNW14481.1 hypothetical protein C1637_05845 [Chryseobacterium lactis]